MLSRRCEAINADSLSAPVRQGAWACHKNVLATNWHPYYITPEARSRAGRQTLETEQMTPALMAGFSQKFISVDACIADYEMDGIATVCDGDTKTADETEETEQ
ncbi:hypothetical protein P9629_gp53 [Shigella phage vB_SboD_StarDew]|uniref:Uncharacterized protein n=1 Tax=Shigella phage vB_SboD_StarDew TaxID=2902747 RepID=A0AAE8YNL8_9CAUD|nr:hypothetical protein P9629_gp53 [Shigella phage vB_SboD_StarDew]UGO46664.1 hypothetical protein STARDEW_53 [Shigella phage vB_SboD_StarDew]